MCSFPSNGVSVPSGRTPTRRRRTRGPAALTFAYIGYEQKGQRSLPDSVAYACRPMIPSIVALTISTRRFVMPVTPEVSGGIVTGSTTLNARQVTSNGQLPGGPKKAMSRATNARTALNVGEPPPADPVRERGAGDDAKGRRIDEAGRNLRPRRAP